MHNRIKAIRNMLGLSQEKFGKKIGLSKFAISNYENGKTPITGRSITDICREFGINEDWLRHGTGDMFKPKNNELDYLIAKYGDLSEAQKALMIAILKMDDKQREAVGSFLDNLLLLRNKT